MKETASLLKNIEDQISFRKSSIKAIHRSIASTQKEIKKLEGKLQKNSKLNDEPLVQQIRIKLGELENVYFEHQKELAHLVDEEAYMNLKDQKSELLIKLQEKKDQKSQEAKIKKEREEELLEELRLTKKAKVSNSYNLIRGEYLSNVKRVFTTIQGEFDDIKLAGNIDHYDFASWLDNNVRELPSVSPVDVKAVAICALISDFSESYGKYYIRAKDDLAPMDHILSRFELTLKLCSGYLDESSHKERFVPCERQYHSDQIIVDDQKQLELNHIFDQINDQVIDTDLKPLLLKRVNDIHIEGIINCDDRERLIASLENPKWLDYEKLIDFDLDEFANTLQNRVNSARRMKKLEGSVPLLHYVNLMACFEYEVEEQSYLSIPNKHNFYSYIDDEDKKELTSILKTLIDINNSYSGVNENIAFTLQSKNTHSFNIKKRIFNFSRTIGHKYFYGTFITQDNGVNTYRDGFLNVFMDYLSPILNKTKKSGFVNQNLLSLKDSILWFVLNSSSYGGTSSFENNRLTTISDRMLLSKGVSSEKLVAYGIANSKEFANILRNEYTTSYFLNHIDLRFTKRVPKFSSVEEYVREIKNMATDLREMRRLLIKNFKPVDSIIELDLPLDRGTQAAIGCGTGKVFVLWQWETFGDGLGRICVGYDKNHMKEQASKKSRMDAQYNRILRVNWDGLISAVESPWLDSSNMDLVCVEVAPDFNLYVLSKFYEMFMGWYSDAAIKLKKRILDQEFEGDTVVEGELPNDVLIEGIYLDKYDYEQIYIQNTLNAQEPDDEQSQNQVATYNRTIKSKKFFAILEKVFDVVVKQGKGSEVNVSRVAHGGRVFRLGHHGVEREYSATHVRKVLKRLNINLIDWNTALAT